MKILIVIDSLGSGGAQRLKENLAKAFTRHGHQVDIFIYVSGDQFYGDDFSSLGVKVLVADKKGSGFSFQVVKQLRSIIKNGNYDGIISSMHAPSIYAALAKLGINQGSLVVCEESSSNAPVPTLRKFLFYLSTLVANYVVTNSYNEAKLLGRFPGISKKISTIWNGYEIQPAPVGFERSNSRISKLLVVGRIAYPKNGLNLLKGLSLFLSRNGWAPEIQWAGRKDIDRRSLLMQEEMEQFLTENPDVASHFKMLGEVKGIEEFYKSSDALMHVSIFEGLPNVICEAMLLGCPVIASNVCDHPKVIGQEERGLLCEPNSPESICDAIERLESMSVDKRTQMLFEARKFAEENFDIEHMAREYEKLLIND